MLIRGLQAGQVNNSQTQGQEHSTSRAGSFVFLPRAQVPVLSRRPPVGRCRSPSRAASKTAFTRPTPPPLTMSVSGSVSATASTSFRMNRRAREGSPCPTQRRSTRSARHNGLPVGQRRERIAAARCAFSLASLVTQGYAVKGSSPGLSLGRPSATSPLEVAVARRSKGTVCGYPMPSQTRCTRQKRAFTPSAGDA